MNRDQAVRILSEPRYLKQVIEGAIGEMNRGVLEPPAGEPTTMTPERISELRAIVRGMRIVQSFITEAEQTVQTAQEDAAERAARGPEAPPPMPPALISAMLGPRVTDGQ